MKLFKSTKSLNPPYLLIFAILFVQSITGQIDSEKGPIFDYFRNAGYRIEFGFANVTAEGVLGDGIRYKKGNSVVYLFNNGINGIAFEGDLTDPDIVEFFNRYESGINATPEIIALSRAAYAVQNKVLGVNAPDDVKFFDFSGDPIPDDSFFDRSDDIFEAEVSTPVITNVFKGIARPGSELNLDAKGKPVNPSIFIAGPTAKLGYANFNWNNLLALPQLSELTEGVTNIRFLYEDIPIVGESGEVLEAFLDFFDNTGEAGGINFASDLERLYNAFANQQGYGAELKTFNIAVTQSTEATALLDVSAGTVRVVKIDGFRELTGILSPKGTTSKPQKNVKSTTKVPGNPKGISEDLARDDVDTFKYGGAQVERRDSDADGSIWSYPGSRGGSRRLSDIIGVWDRRSRDQHTKWLQIDYNALDAEVDALNVRLFNGEDLPLGLGVSSDPNIRFAPLSIDFLLNYALVNNLDIESAYKLNTTEAFINTVFQRRSGDGSGGDNGGGGDDGDDLPIDRPDGGGFDDEPGSGGGGGSNCVCSKFGCSCSSFRQYNTDETYSIPSVLITKSFLRNPGFLTSLSEDLGLSDKKLIQKLFMQALTLRNEKQGLLLNENQVNAEQAELYHITYNAAAAAKQQLLDHLNSTLETLNTTTVWMQLLQKRDQKLYATILNKLTKFYQKESGITDGSVFIAPQFNFELSITPTIPVVNYEEEAALALNAMEYDIDIVLTSARLTLGVDTDADFKADLGVVLNETELQFILDTWAQDTDGDKFIDEGYIVWLQQQLVTTKQHLAEEMKLGTSEAYKRYNQLVLPLAVADFYKKQLLEDNSLDLDTSKWRNLVDTDAIEASNLLAVENISYDNHTDIVSEYFFNTQTAKGKGIVFNPSKAIIKWNPITLLGKSTQNNGNKSSASSTARTAATLAPTLRFSNTGFALKPDVLMLGVGSEGTITLTNTTNQALAPETYVLTTSTSEDALYFDVAKFDVPEIPVNGTVELFFDYTAVAADSESGNMEEFRLHRVGDFNTILLRKDFLIQENIMEAIDFNSFCEESPTSFSTITNDIVLAGQNLVTGNIIESNGKLTAKVIETIDLVVGFEAKPGATVDFSITDCNGVQQAIITSMNNNMQ